MAELVQSREDYSLAEVDIKIKRFADKQGSDYFPMPVLLDYFKTATIDFVSEKLKNVEKTQQVVDDIRPLIVPGKLNIIKDPNDNSRFIAALPLNYFKILSYDILYSDQTRCRRADLIRHGEYKTNYNNPNRTPTKYYPVITQENNLFQIDIGKEIIADGVTVVPEFMKIMYCKIPNFATVSNTNIRIVNLPDESIEKIILSTVTRLFNSTGDQRTQSNYQLQEAFRKFSK